MTLPPLIMQAGCIQASTDTASQPGISMHMRTTTRTTYMMY